MLEDRERQLVFRLTPSAFDNDRAWWGQSLSTAYWQRGDLAEGARLCRLGPRRFEGAGGRPLRRTRNLRCSTG